METSHRHLGTRALPGTGCSNEEDVEEVAHDSDPELPTMEQHGRCHPSDTTENTGLGVGRFRWDPVSCMFNSRAFATTAFGRRVAPDEWHQ